MITSLTAVLSDVHGNDFALQRCLDDARRQAERTNLPLEFWFLGDIANGPPGVSDSLLLLHELGDELREWLIGNHDLAQLLWWSKLGTTHLPLSRQNREIVTQKAAHYIRVQAWRELLADDVNALDYIRRSAPRLWKRWVLAPTWTISADFLGVFLVHGLIVEPDMRGVSNTIHGLLDQSLTIQLNRMVRLLQEYSQEQPRLVLTGHTHVATAWAQDQSGKWSQLSVGDHESADILYADDANDHWFRLEPDKFWVLNVGAVGMQRMQQKELAKTTVYLLLGVDEEETFWVSFRRIPYDLNQALHEYKKRGCPAWLLRQLEMGY